MWEFMGDPRLNESPRAREVSPNLSVVILQRGQGVGGQTAPLPRNPVCAFGRDQPRQLFYQGLLRDSRSGLVDPQRYPSSIWIGCK